MYNGGGGEGGGNKLYHYNLEGKLSFFLLGVYISIYIYILTLQILYLFIYY